MFIIINIIFTILICAYVGIIININHYDKHLTELFLDREMFQIKCVFALVSKVMNFRVP